MNKRLTFIGSCIITALALVMLLTHTWIFGLVGAVFCIKRAIIG